MTESAPRRAERAKREWDEISAAFDAVRDAAVLGLRQVTPTDTSKMRALVVTLQNLDAVREVVMQTIESGRLEEAAEALRERLKLD